MVQSAAGVKRPGRGRWLPWLFVVWLLWSAPAGADQFRAADSQPESYPSVLALQYMAQLVAERSSSRHTIEVFGAAQLGPEVHTVTLTRAGIIDLDRLNIGAFNDEIPETQIASMPYLFRDEQHAREVFDGPIGTEILAAFERHGLVGLAFFETSARSFYSLRGPVRAPADLKGMRFRPLSSALMAAMMEAFGAIPVNLGYGQLRNGLAANLLDGAELNLIGYHDTGLFRIARTFSLTRHSYSPGVLVMSARTWERLSDADRILFREAAHEASAYLHRLWDQREPEVRAALIADGVTIVEDVDRSAFIAAMQPVYDRFATQPLVAAMITRIRGVP